MWTQLYTVRRKRRSERFLRRALSVHRPRSATFRENVRVHRGVLAALADDERSDSKRLQEPSPLSFNDQPERIFLADLPLLSITETSRKPERWERVGAYAVFDEERVLQYVGYTKNVLVKLQLHRKLQPSLCRYFKVFFPAPGTIRVEPDSLEAVLCDWIKENGRVPNGNYQPECWEDISARKVAFRANASSTKMAGGAKTMPGPSERSRAAPFRDESDTVPGASESFTGYQTERAAAFYEEDEEDMFDLRDRDLQQTGTDWWNRLVQVFTGPSVPLPTGTIADESVRIRVLDKQGNVRSERALMDTDPSNEGTGYGSSRDRRMRVARASSQTRDPYLDQVMRIEREEAERRGTRNARRAGTRSSDARDEFRTRGRQGFQDEGDLLDDWDEPFIDNGLQDWMPFLAFGGLALFLYLLSSLTNGGSSVPPESLGF
ncbi:hypothetical protein CCYA_CCYA10G2971 [Cyanidiococcus yangmingshanensis]|nr:hypothetical protein CCYA_CCYA10G2971 [Cyanidiococcus yangmingshanensis]